MSKSIHIDGKDYKIQNMVADLIERQRIRIDELQTISDEWQLNAEIYAEYNDKYRAEKATLEEALYQSEHFVTFTEDGWSIEHLVGCRPDMTACEFHQRMQNIAFREDERRGRFIIKLKPLGDLEFIETGG